MVVDIYLSLRSNIYLIFLMLGYRCCQLLVKRMNTLNNDRMIFLHPYRSSAFTSYGLEVNAWQCDLFTVDKVKQILVESFNIKTIDVLKINAVRSCVLNTAYLVTVAVVIVHRDHNRIDPA